MGKNKGRRDISFGRPSQPPVLERASALPGAQGRVEHRLETFSGPLPPPDLLEGYERAFPGAAERIFALTENQSRHRQDLESTVVRGNVAAQGRGQWMGFVVAMTSVVGGVVLLAIGRDIAGYATIFVPLSTLAGIFLWTRSKQSRERESKAKQVDSGTVKGA